MNRPLLSICIPTYNRAQYLKDCLDNIIGQFRDRDIYEQIEVVISDNASKDNTQELVREYQKDFFNIRYFRNKENLGFDRNVDAVLTKAIGKFCWLMSDDDIIEKKALSFILGVIKRYPEISYIGINPKGAFEKERIQYWRTGKKFVSLKGLLPPDGLLSHCIINKKFLPPDRKKYYGNYWFHYSSVLEIIADKPFIVVNKDLFKKNEHKSRMETEGAYFFSYNHLKNIIKNLPQFGYEKKSVNRLLKGFARGAPRNIASAKIHGLKISWRNFILIIKNYYQYPIWLLLSIIVFLIPSFFLKQFKKLISQKKYAT